MNDEIVIIDYNMGNLRSVQKAFEKFKSKTVISNDHNVIKAASKLVLPGVGAFKDGMKQLNNLGLVDLLNEEVIQLKKPFLGICLGMQLISSKSYEHGETSGLNWVDASVIKFNLGDLKIPHVGWNSVILKNKNKLFEGVPDMSDFYFVHSFHFQTSEDVISSLTNYGIDFVSSINKENIYAFQFHPEKSQTVGLKLIENFIKL